MKTSCVFSWSPCSFLAHLHLSVRASISSPTSCCSKARWLSDSAILPYKYQWSMSTIRAAGCAAVGHEGLHGEKISAITKTMMQSQNKLCGPKCWVCMISLAKFLNQYYVFVFFQHCIMVIFSRMRPPSLSLCGSSEILIIWLSCKTLVPQFWQSAILVDWCRQA